MATINDDEFIIRAPRLERFRPEPSLTCAKCGAHQFGRMATFVSSMFSSGVLSVFSVNYCAGGLAPTEQLDGLMGSIMMATTGSDERRHSCSGVHGGHLHITCKKCGFEVLSRTMDGGVV